LRCLAIFVRNPDNPVGQLVPGDGKSLMTGHGNPG